MLTLPDSLLASLDAGRTVVVPDPAKAGAVRLAYAGVLVARGRRTWARPDVLSWTQWLDREVGAAAMAGVPMPRPLADVEQWVLWHECAARAALALGFEASDALIEGLRRAASLVADWEIPRRTLARPGVLESSWLAGSLERFEARCAERIAAPLANVARTLARCRSGSVDLAGFVPFTRAQQALLSRWRAGGAELRTLDTTRETSRTALAKAADAADELAMAADWARDRLIASPRRRLLIVLPQLASQREGVERVFTRAIDGTPTAGASGIAFAGAPSLAAAPLARHALNSLQLVRARLEWEVVSAWLRAPYWEEPAAAARASLDAWLRECLDVRVTASELLAALRVAPEGVRPAAERVAARLAGCTAVFGEAPTAAPREWADRFTAALAALGYPGKAGLEERSHVRLVETVNHLAALPSERELTFEEAFTWLERLVARQSLDAPTADAAVTITDSIADPVVHYDGIWVAGLNAGSWPAPHRPDPFIPVELQLAAGVPTASPAGQLASARTALRSWQRATGELVLSYPSQADESAQVASALLEELGSLDSLSLPERRSIPARLRDGRRVETWDDDRGEPWTERRALPRGARSVEHQIRCAFRAYAELRLDARALEAPRPGIDPRDRGRLVHRVLELTWRELRDSRELAARSQEELDALIVRLARRAAGELIAENPSESRVRNLRREERRAIDLVRQLCALEATRAPFSVLRTEVTRPVRFASGVLNVRIDRIDRLADGTLVLIDFKTGVPQPPDWFAERPSQPQLLVYLRAVEEEVTALATAHLANGRVGFRGVADRDGRLPKVKGVGAVWARHVASWSELIERAVRDFVDGRAVRDPIPGACAQCHLAAVCRIGDAAVEPYA